MKTLNTLAESVSFGNMKLPYENFGIILKKSKKTMEAFNTLSESGS
jgi:hypothetical protein